MRERTGDRNRQHNIEAPLRALILRQSTPEETVRILTQWKNRKLTVEQLTYAANIALPEYLTEHLSTVRSALRKELQCAPRDLYVEGAACVFPQGNLSYRYENQTRDRGLLHAELRLDCAWMEDLHRLQRLLDCLQFNAEDLAFETAFALNPLDQLETFEARGWETLRESEDNVVLLKENITLQIEPSLLTFHGIVLSDLLPQSDKHDSEGAGEQGAAADFFFKIVG